MKRGEPLIKLPPPTVYPNAIDNVKLRPKLKKPDRDVIGEDAAEVALLNPKRMMGFREWCEKVWDRREVLVDDPTAAK
jgi:hypothetical protein